MIEHGDPQASVVIMSLPVRDLSAREHSHAAPRSLAVHKVASATAAATRNELLLLWALLAWYTAVVTPYLATTSSHVWSNALLFSLIVGTGMVSNAFSAQRDGVALRSWATANPFLVLRFYATPFAVSSYSGVVAGDPDRFAAIFPRESSALIPACLLAAGVPACAAVVHAFVRAPRPPAQAEATKLLHAGAAAVALPAPPR